MDTEHNRIEFKPNLPARWKRVDFKIVYRGNLFAIGVEKKKVEITHEKEYENSSSLRLQGKKNHPE